MLSFIHLYKAMRAGHPPRCRFYPSCSQFALEAISTEGVWKGGGRTLRRILSCHPWHAGGYDPVVHL